MEPGGLLVLVFLLALIIVLVTIKNVISDLRKIANSQDVVIRELVEIKESLRTKNESH